MKYLEKLLHDFSDTPREIILHADMLRRGIRETQDLIDAGDYASITGISTKLQGLAGQKKPTPSMFHFKGTNVSVDIKIDPTSPYEIKKQDGKLYLDGGGQNFGEIWFAKRASYTDKQTDDGEQCAALLLQRGPYCLMVNPLEFCAYYKNGEACKYCILAFAMDAGVKANLMKPVPDPEMIAQAVEYACQDINLKDLKLCGGALYDLKKEAVHYKKCLEAILKRIAPPEEIQIFSQAFDEEDMKDLKALGATTIIYNIEVWNESLWPELLPGKTKAIGRAEWIKRLEKAVAIFGRGRVGTGFVGGFECAPRPGFLSQEQALKSYLEGFEYLIERGILPWFTVWTAVPIAGGFNPGDPPSTEWYLRLGLGLHELLDQYDFYKDLGFPRMGVDPPTLGLYCYYCFSMTFTRDYPRLIGRKDQAA
ncbi:MAG TPA: radical SAM protein [bacterium]|nr:radical SAM protein [bacterium]